jgi:DNA-binding CsgD family transcriptional regulator/tetratricopeptide (TPR) repeat protein
MLELAVARFEASFQVREHVERVEADYDNCRLALSFYADAQDATRELRMAVLLERFWFFRGWLREGIAILQDAIDRGDSALLAVRADAIVSLAQFYGETGDPDRAVAASGRGLDLAREAGDELLLLQALVNRGMTFRWDNQRLDEAIEVLEEAVVLGESLDRPIMGIVAMMNLGAALFDRGAQERGIALLEESLAACRAREMNGLAALALARLGRVAQVEGKHALAAERYHESLQLNWATGAAMYYDRVLVGLAGLAIDYGQTEVAARLVGAVEVIQQHTGATSLMWPEELERVRAALRADANPDRYAGEVETGRRLTPEVVQADALAMADAIIESASTSHLQSAPDSHFGLSRRELEVLRHLAEGKTDREIAVSLFTSPRTVNTQVTSIYGKLGVHSRTEAALAAQRAGLLEE